MNKIKIALTSLMLIINYLFLGFIMAHDLYFNNQKQSLCYLDLYPQPNIYLNELSYTTNNSYTLFKSPISIPSACTVWYNYPDNDIRDRFIYTAYNFKNAYCGYDNKGNLKNGYLFEKIPPHDISPTIYKNVDTLSRFASAKVDCTIKLTATTPIGTGVCELNINPKSLSIVGDEPSSGYVQGVVIPEFFTFEDVDPTAAREYLCDSYTIKFNQGPTILYYEKNTNPTSKEISNFVSNITGKSHFQGIVVYIPENGRSYVWSDSNNSWRSDISLTEDCGNLISIELQQLGAPKKNGSFVQLDIINLQVTQILLDTSFTSITQKTKTIANIPDPDFTSQSIQFDSTPILGQDSSTVFIGIIYTSSNYKYLLDGVYINSNTMASSTTYKWSTGNRKVYYGGDVFNWTYEITQYNTSLSSNNRIKISNIKWEKRATTGVLFPIEIIVVYTE